MRKQASPDSTGCHLPAAVTTSCHKHPLGADHPSPGQCLRLDPFYHSSQASAAGRSSSTMHCSQRGHLTPETPSASREVTGAPSNHLQMNLPPETTSPSTPDSETPPATAHSAPPPNPQGAKHCHRLVRMLLACRPERCRDVRTSAKTAWQEAGQESTGDGYSGSGGAGISVQSSRLGVRQPLFCSTIVHRAPGVVVVSSSRTIQHGCCLL